MSKNLVIVESPAKARTVGRFLGKSYVAKASMGHIRDLPKKTMGVKVDDLSFTPKYTLIPDRRKIIDELRTAVKNADNVYLATDPDREGEAISWHLIAAAKIEPTKIKRVVFHEITKDAVQHAFDNPREVDYNLVAAQQARRILDRLVGYELSPVLWKKVRPGLSAGRVQSLAVKLVIERETEHNDFVPQEYWTISATLSKDKSDKMSFDAKLTAIEGSSKDLGLDNEKNAQAVLSDLSNAEFNVRNVAKKQTIRRPPPPFITSTLQQDASRKFRFSASNTMRVAQQLYEGLDLGLEGSVGLITYMRTDSTNVSKSAIMETTEFIKKEYGDKYLLSKPRFYKTKVKGAQEAHEAIRPTSILNTPEKIRKYLNKDQFRLYKLIWNRMICSQMPDALFDQTKFEIVANAKTSKEYLFTSVGTVLKFDGYRTIYMESEDDSKDELDDKNSLPQLTKGDYLNCLSILKKQHFTEAPPLYTEAALIKLLEEKGIGRPSTYASIMGTIQDRYYVQKNNNRFVSTKLGKVVNTLLTQHFTDTMNVGFTAKLEAELDEIASGEREWVPVIKEFYVPFHDLIKKSDINVERVPRSEIDEESDEVCESCERPMVIKVGRYGRFLSCSGFPECKVARPLVSILDVNCPECANKLVEKQRRGRANKTFYGCSNYPNCNFATNRKPISEPCPECKGLLVMWGRNRARCFKCPYKGTVNQDEKTTEQVEIVV
tara:strand:- start:571 stop:2724 length:2154 start_codon:yes stop_codon:yes gene_type:complete